MQKIKDNTLEYSPYIRLLVLMSFFGVSIQALCKKNVDRFNKNDINIERKNFRRLYKSIKVTTVTESDYIESLEIYLEEKNFPENLTREYDKLKKKGIKNVISDYMLFMDFFKDIMTCNGKKYLKDIFKENIESQYKNIKYVNINNYTKELYFALESVSSCRYELAKGKN